MKEKGVDSKRNLLLKFYLRLVVLFLAEHCVCENAEDKSSCDGCERYSTEGKSETADTCDEDNR